MSTVIETATYKPKSRRLDIRFISGAQYRYKGVPQHVYDGLFHAESKGQYFNQHIKNQYQTKRKE